MNNSTSSTFIPDHVINDNLIAFQSRTEPCETPSKRLRARRRSKKSRDGLPIVLGNSLPSGIRKTTSNVEFVRLNPKHRAFIKVKKNYIKKVKQPSDSVEKLNRLWETYSKRCVDTQFRVLRPLIVTGNVVFDYVKFFDLMNNFQANEWRITEMITLFKVGPGGVRVSKLGLSVLFEVYSKLEEHFDWEVIPNITVYVLHSFSRAFDNENFLSEAGHLYKKIGIVGCKPDKKFYCKTYTIEGAGKVSSSSLRVADADSEVILKISHEFSSTAVQFNQSKVREKVNERRSQPVVYKSYFKEVSEHEAIDNSEMIEGRLYTRRNIRHRRL